MSWTRSAAGKPAFLPDAIESGLRLWARRAAGALLMLLVAAAWASLVSWNASDPALTSSSEPSVNFLGDPGALTADWLLQCFGFAAAMALFAPTNWAADLLAGRSLPSRHERFFLWPMSVVMAAGAMAALPAPSAWPIGHGLGGLFGDRLITAVTNLMAAAGLGGNSLLAGLLLAVAALLLSLPLLGVTSLDALTGRRAAMPAPQREPDLAEPDMLSDSWFADEPLPADADLDHTPARARLSITKGRAPAFTSADTNLEAGLLGPLTVDEADNENVGQESEPTLHWNEPDAGAMTPELPPPVATVASPPDRLAPERAAARQKPLHVPYEHDFTEPLDDDGSSNIARRFAPGPSTFDAEDDERTGLGGLSWRRAWRRPAEAVEPSFVEPSFVEPSFVEPIVAPPAPRDAASARPAEPVSAPHGLAERRQPSGRERQRGFRLPSLKLLDPGPATRPGADVQPAALKLRVQNLETVLHEFGIKGRIVGVRPGPVVTLFELEPAPGLKTGRVVGLADDIARSMAARSARIAAIPGRNIIGIELPNERRETVYLRGLLESDAFKRSTATLPVVIGRSIEGEPIIADLARMPHLLIAGTTGSGKSVGVNAMILSLLYRFTPEQCRLILIDPKVLELSAYADIPHLLTPIVTDASKAVAALGWAVAEMEERYQRMALLNVRNIETYNNAVRNAQRQGSEIKRTVQTGFDRHTGQAIYENETLSLETLPIIVIVIDEMADLMLTAGKEFEVHVQRLAQKARAAGIHLITATQRPSVDVVTGVIKANLPARLSYRVASKIDSRTVLNEQGAEHLLGAGDLLFNPGSGAVRAHGPYVADDEVAQVAEELRRNGPPTYIDAVTAMTTEANGSETAADTMYDDALNLVLTDRKATISHLQRKLSIGYNRAAELIERLEADGIIGPAEGGKRPILTGAAATKRSA